MSTELFAQISSVNPKEQVADDGRAPGSALCQATEPRNDPTEHKDYVDRNPTAHKDNFDQHRKKLDEAPGNPNEVALGPLFFAEVPLGRVPGRQHQCGAGHKRRLGGRDVQDVDAGRLVRAAGERAASYNLAGAALRCLLALDQVGLEHRLDRGERLCVKRDRRKGSLILLSRGAAPPTC